MPVSMKDIVSPRITPLLSRIKTYLDSLPEDEFVFSHELKQKVRVGKDTIHNFQQSKEGSQYYQTIGNTRYFGKPSSIKKLCRSIGAPK